MEDVADALKIAFAVLVFTIGFTIFFNIVTLAKNTSDTVFLSIDKANYYQYTDFKTQKNRIVTLKDIIPTIYRYIKEYYGVTIIDKDGNLVARFDINTDSAVLNYINSTNKDATQVLKIFDKIFKTYGKEEKVPKIEDVLKNIYANKTDDNKYSVEWNSGKEEIILKRLKSDIYGIEDELIDHKPICNCKGLYETYKNKEFQEYVFEIDKSEYFNDSGELSKNIEEETVVKSSGVRKIEIIYVEN